MATTKLNKTKIKPTKQNKEAPAPRTEAPRPSLIPPEALIGAEETAKDVVEQAKDYLLKRKQLNIEKEKIKTDIKLQQQRLDLERQKANQEITARNQAIAFAREQQAKEEDRRKILAKKEDAIREGNLHALISLFPRLEIEKDRRLEAIKLDLDNNVDITDQEEAYLHAKATALGIEGTVQDESTEHRYDG